MSKVSKRILVGSVVVGLAIIGFILFRTLNPAVGFAYFQPSNLPPHVSIKARRITISRGSIQVEQNFRTEDWVYTIQEYKADESTTIGAADQNYNEKSIQPTCSINNSAANTRYRLCHWIDYGRIDVHEVSFVKDGTFIYSQIPTATSQRISIQEIEAYIDSFKRKSTIGLPVLRSNGP